MIIADCKQELEQILNSYLEEDDEAPTWVGAKLGVSSSYEIIATECIDSGRWSRWDMMVVRGPAKSLWGFEVESDPTEYHERPESYEVFPVEAVPTTVYRRAS